MSAWMVIITWDEGAKSAKTLCIKSFCRCIASGDKVANRLKSAGLTRTAYSPL